jgi:hypothetical protein
MKVTKKELLSLVKQNLQEMAIDYEGPERPNPDVDSDLEAGNTPLSIVPTPETGRANQNFLELLASERYKEVVDKVRQITQYQGPIVGQNMGPLGMMMINAHTEIQRLERNYHQELIDLAIEVVKKEMGLPDNIENKIKFIVDMGHPNSEGFKMGGQISPAKQESPDVSDEEMLSDEEIANITPENQEMEMELFQDVQNVDSSQELEESKLRLIKAIVAGSSKKGHWMYQLLGERLRQITGSDQLFNLYGVMMSVNDLNYWQFSAANLEMAQAGSIAGRVDVVRPTSGNDDDDDEFEGDMMGGGDMDEPEDDEDDFTPNDPRIDPEKTNIIVKGVNFPVLIHEILKGLMKTLALEGQPSKGMYTEIRDKQELLSYEIWDLRLGPAIWRRLYESFPIETLEEQNKNLQNYIMMEIFALPAKKFLVLMKEIMGETDRGKRLIALIYGGIVKMLRDEDYEDAMEQYQTELDSMSNNTNDDQLLNDLNGFLGDKGISLSKDDLDDEESDEDFLNQFR